LISTLWGLFVWREFKGAKTGVVVLLALMLALYVGGLGLVAIAPLHGN
jgi:glucose uptake protein